MNGLQQDDYIFKDNITPPTNIQQLDIPQFFKFCFSGTLLAVCKIENLALLTRYVWKVH